MPEQLSVTVHINAGFFARFADGRLGEVSITALHATTGTRDVPAPRITLELGALDHEELRLPVCARAEQDEDRGPASMRRRLDLQARICRERADQPGNGGMPSERRETGITVQYQSPIDFPSGLRPAANATGQRTDIGIAHLLHHIGHEC